MSNFEKSSQEEPDDNERSQEGEVNPELKQELEKFEDNVGEVSEEAEGIDLEKASTEDLEKLSTKTEFILRALGTVAGAGLMVGSAYFEGGDFSSWKHVADAITKGIMMGGGAALFIMNAGKFERSLEELGGTWQKVKSALRAKKG